MSKNTVKYILMFLGILILLASYLLVYTDYTSKTDALRAEIKTLGDRFDVLSGHEMNLPKYEDTIARDKTEIAGMLGRYYSIEWPEDFIMLATELENNVGLSAAGLTFDSPAPVYTVNGVTDGTDVRMPVTPVQYICYRTSSTVKTTMAYDQMKEALDYISSLKDVTKLNSLNLTYDSATGLISGDFVLEKYYITGRDIPDHVTDIPYVELGKDILIGG